jgi:putative spermidine/putrescine transport system ATP-binding protein
MADPIVTFERVRKTYDGATEAAVHDLDLQVTQGEFLTLLGPSGSGKTTTLMMLAGFEEPSSGRITVAGADMARVPPHRRGLGVVFQNYALFPHMSVAGNVAFPLSVRGVSRAGQKARIADALAMVRLEGFADRRPAQLSGGQQQRVALARALVFQPKLVLMDEPLGALDRALREEMQDEIRRIHAALGVTVLYVTHDQAEALTMSDRIAVFHQGRLRQVAAPAALYERPADAFVARFVGETNFLPGEISGHDGEECAIRLADGRVLEGTAVDAPAQGRAVLAVRPERIAVAAVAAHDLSDSALPARVVETVYLGDAVRLRLDLGGGVTLVAKRPVAAAGAALAPGAEVAVAWAPEHARVFAPEA